LLPPPPLPPSPWDPLRSSSAGTFKLPLFFVGLDPSPFTTAKEEEDEEEEERLSPEFVVLRGLEK